MFVNMPKHACHSAASCILLRHVVATSQACYELQQTYMTEAFCKAQPALGLYNICITAFAKQVTCKEATNYAANLVTCKEATNYAANLGSTQNKPAAVSKHCLPVWTGHDAKHTQATAAWLAFIAIGNKYS